MTRHIPRHTAAADPPAPRRSVRNRPVLAGAGAGLALTCLVAAALLVATAPRGESGPAAGSCSGGPALRIAAAAEIAPAIEAVAAAAPPEGCPPEVVASEPSAVAAALRDEQLPADVWVPDSSIWTIRLAGRSQRDIPQQSPSLAASPFVLAVPAAVAAATAASAGGDGGPAPGMDLEALVPATGQPPAVQWALPDPDQSAGTVAALVALRAALGDRPDAAAVLTSVVRASDQQPGPDARTASLVRTAGGGPALAATEQQVAAHNAVFPAARLAAAYPRTPVVADYPYVVLTSDPDRRALAADVLERLRGGEARARLLAAGFRAPDGVADPSAPARAGIDPSRPATGPAVTAAAVGEAETALAAISRPSRLLAVLDVSGSMATPVPGASGVSRLGLAVQAAVTGLALYPDDTVAGLWVFSTGLTPSTDYREVVPMVPLGRGLDGVSGRQRLAEGLHSVAVTDGWTGLYDTVLAAVRQVRSAGDAQRVSSVVLITDGGNEDPTGGVDLPTLLQTLREEDDPAHPVPVFAISYGPDGDIAALDEVARATGGKAYVARDPQDIGAVMLDAIGRRACAPGC